MTKYNKPFFIKQYLSWFKNLIVVGIGLYSFYGDQMNIKNLKFWRLITLLVEIVIIFFLPDANGLVSDLSFSIDFNISTEVRGGISFGKR